MYSLISAHLRGVFRVRRPAAASHGSFASGEVYMLNLVVLPFQRPQHIIARNIDLNFTLYLPSQQIRLHPSRSHRWVASHPGALRCPRLPRRKRRC
jgi:hypothetical protein